MDRRVLIADDEYSARKMLHLYLSTLEGYTIVGEAANGQKALELFRELKPDVLITDIQMPIMNGLELIEHIRQEKEDQIVIILSCYESFSFAQRAIRLGVKDYLVKDMITPEELGDCLDHATAGLEPEKTPEVKPFAPKPQDIRSIRGIVPEHAGLIEQELQALSGHFFTRDAGKTVQAIENLYRAHFSGMTQFCFLQQINQILISWIIDECVRHSIPTEQVLTGAGSPLSILECTSDPQIACTLLCKWVQQLMEQLADTGTESPRIRQVITYLNENYHRDLSLQSIADHFHIHKVYLSRSFKEETGTNLNSYLSYLRIEKAKLLLCMKTYRTNEIAYMVGFNNTQNFYNAFRKLVGCSPSDYLERMPDNQPHSHSGGAI
jgi:two-component system response regulator YesN